MWCLEITLEELNKSVFNKVQQNQRNQPQPFSLTATTTDKKNLRKLWSKERVKGSTDTEGNMYILQQKYYWSVIFPKTENSKKLTKNHVYCNSSKDYFIESH